MAVRNHHGEDFMQLSWLHSKKTKIIIWTVILVFLLCGIYAYTHRSRVSVGKTSAHPLVKVEKMERKDMMKRVVLSGDTVPRESVDISPKYAGRLEKVYVDLGDKVTKGDILVSQDTKDISYSIAQNRAGSHEAAADAVLARIAKGETLQAIAATDKLQTGQLPGIPRGAPMPSPEINAALFSAQRPAEGKVSAGKALMQGGGYAVFVVDKVNEGDATKITPEQRVQLQQQIVQMEGAAAVESFVATMRKKFKVIRHEDRL